MSRKANPTAIGGFAVGAVLLIVVAIGVFGSGRFFQETLRFVMFFEGAVQGLQVGSPVMLRGVEIGQVVELKAIYNPETTEIMIPVIIKTFEERIAYQEGKRADGAERDIRGLIERGMRAQLVQRSFVTGQQAVSIDFHPDTEIRLVETNLPYMQIPTIPSSFEQVESAFADAPELLRSGDELLTRVVRVFSDKNLDAIDNIVANISGITGNFDQASGKVEQLVEKIDVTVEEIAATAREAQATLDAMEKDREVLRDELAKTGESMTRLADNVDGLFEENRKAIDDFTEIGLDEFSNLATSSEAAMAQFSRTMEEMERDPARFFLGPPGTVKAQ